MASSLMSLAAPAPPQLIQRLSHQTLRQGASTPQPPPSSSSSSSLPSDDSRRILARADSLSVRPSHLATGTRLRARSVTTMVDVLVPDVPAAPSSDHAWDPSPSLHPLGESDDARTMSSDDLPCTPSDSDVGSYASTPLTTPIHSSWPTDSEDSALPHPKRGRSRSRTLDELIELRSGLTCAAQDRDGLPLYTDSEGSDRSISPPTNSTTPSVPTLSSGSGHASASPYPIHSLNNMLPRLALLLVSLCTSFLIIVYLVSTVPHLQLPTSLQVVRSQIAQLCTYASHSTASYIHILVVLSVTFVWKQAFSIPGSALVNVLMGAIYGTYLATALTCLLTAVGSTVAYWMAQLARPVFQTYMPKPLAIVQRALDRFLVDGPATEGSRKHNYDRAELTSYLLVARLLPVVPYAALNIASGVLDLPLGPFFWTLVVGSAPYNYVTTSVGDLLSLATESEDIKSIWSAGLLMKLLVVSVVGAVPVLFKGSLQSIVVSWLGGNHAHNTVSDPIGPPTDSTGRFSRAWISTTRGSHRRSAEYERVPMADLDTGVRNPSDHNSSIRSMHSHSTSASTRRNGGNGWKRTLKRVSWKRLSESLSGFDPASLLTSPSRSIHGDDRTHHHHSSSPETSLRSPRWTDDAVPRARGDRDRRVASVVGGKVRSLGDEWVTSGTILVYGGDCRSHPLDPAHCGHQHANSWGAGHIRYPPNAAIQV